LTLSERSGLAVKDRHEWGKQTFDLTYPKKSDKIDLWPTPLENGRKRTPGMQTYSSPKLDDTILRSWTATALKKGGAEIHTIQD